MNPHFLPIWFSTQYFFLLLFSLSSDRKIRTVRNHSRQLFICLHLQSIFLSVLCSPTHKVQMLKKNLTHRHTIFKSNANQRVCGNDFMLHEIGIPSNRYCSRAIFRLRFCELSKHLTFRGPESIRHFEHAETSS